MFDPIPESFEFCSLEHGLTGLHLHAVIRILDLQAPGELAKDLLHLRQLVGERLRQCKGSILECRAQSVLHFAFGIYETGGVQMLP